MMKRIVTAVALATFAVATVPAMADGHTKCGKGKVFDTEQQKCVKKPRGGSGSGAEIQ
jgi:hypothetical protein